MWLKQFYSIFQIFILCLSELVAFLMLFRYELLGQIKSRSFAQLRRPKLSEWTENEQSTTIYFSTRIYTGKSKSWALSDNKKHVFMLTTFQMRIINILYVACLSTIWKTYTENGRESKSYRWDAQHRLVLSFSIRCFSISNEAVRLVRFGFSNVTHWTMHLVFMIAKLFWPKDHIQSNTTNTIGRPKEKHVLFFRKFSILLTLLKVIFKIGCYDIMYKSWFDNKIIFKSLIQEYFCILECKLQSVKCHVLFYTKI